MDYIIRSILILSTIICSGLILQLFREEKTNHKKTKEGKKIIEGISDGDKNKFVDINKNANHEFIDINKKTNMNKLIDMNEFINKQEPRVMTQQEKIKEDKNTFNDFLENTFNLINKLIIPCLKWATCLALIILCWKMAMNKSKNKHWMMILIMLMLVILFNFKNNRINDELIKPKQENKKDLKTEKTVEIKKPEELKLIKMEPKPKKVLPASPIKILKLLPTNNPRLKIKNAVMVTINKSTNSNA
jgi:hypothetical protein